jgi:hypothetical protein
MHSVLLQCRCLCISAILAHAQTPPQAGIAAQANSLTGARNSHKSYNKAVKHNVTQKRIACIGCPADVLCAWHESTTHLGVALCIWQLCTNSSDDVPERSAQALPQWAWQVRVTA